MNRSHETRFVRGCALAAGHPGNSAIPLIHDLYRAPARHPARMTPSKWAVPAAFCPPRISAVNERSPSRTSYMASSPTTCPFRLGCRHRTSPTYEPTDRHRRTLPGDQTGAATRAEEVQSPHFVKVISTGRLPSSWPWAMARARDQRHDCYDQRGDAPARASGAHETPLSDDSCQRAMVDPANRGGRSLACFGLVR